MKRNVQINAPLFPSSSRRVDDSSQGAIILLRLNPVSLRQRDVLRPRVHDKLLRGTVSCVSTSARKTYRSLIARTTAHPARGSHRLMAYSRRANGSILLANSLRPHLSRGLGASLLGSRTAVRHLSHESAAHSDLALVRGIPPAQLQLQAAAGVHDTIPTSQFLEHHWRLDVPAHTA
jgi:hypothetical protein